jgi:hypothetical protein
MPALLEEHIWMRRTLEGIFDIGSVHTLGTTSFATSDGNHLANRPPAIITHVKQILLASGPLINEISLIAHKLQH